MATNYFLLLGISPDASPRQIRQAYRQLSKRYHPDVAGHEAQGKFIEISQAYEVLSDPARRQEHLRQVQAHAQPVARPHMRPPPMDLFGGFARYGPSHEQLLHTYRRNVALRHAPKSAAPRQVDVEVVISPAQAMRGTHLPLRVPTYRACGTCGGSGRAGYYVCDQCGGHGLYVQPLTLDVLVPRGTRDRTVIPVSLKPAGVSNLYLHIHVRIAHA